MSWREFLGWFATLYGLNERHAGTLTAWVEQVFIPGGMTMDEVRAAALVVIRGEPPRFVNEILPAILHAIRESRTADLMAREEQEREGGARLGGERCAFCDGSGLAVVPWCPQPEAAVKGDYLATHAVCCKCIAGVRVGTLCRNHHDEALMTLEVYERHNPDWLEQTRWWTRKASAEGKIGTSTQDWDRLVERLLREARRRKG